MAWISLSGYREVGRRLAEIRKREGVSQDQMAALLQKPQSFVSACERGQRRIDVLELVRIATVLKLDPRDLFDSLIPPLPPARSK